MCEWIEESQEIDRFFPSRKTRRAGHSFHRMTDDSDIEERYIHDDRLELGSSATLQIDDSD